MSASGSSMTALLVLNVVTLLAIWLRVGVSQSTTIVVELRYPRAGQPRTLEKQGKDVTYIGKGCHR